MDADFVKWIFEKAGYHLVRKSFPLFVFKKDDLDFEIAHNFDVTSDLYEHIVWPSIIQKAIEEISKEGSFNIHDTIPYHYTVYKQDGEFEDFESCIPIESDFVKAKESALLYIYEQENNNEKTD